MRRSQLDWLAHGMLLSRSRTRRSRSCAGTASAPRSRRRRSRRRRGVEPRCTLHLADQRVELAGARRAVPDPARSGDAAAASRSPRPVARQRRSSPYAHSARASVGLREREPDVRDLGRLRVGVAAAERDRSRRSSSRRRARVERARRPTVDVTRGSTSVRARSRTRHRSGSRSAAGGPADGARRCASQLSPASSLVGPAVHGGSSCSASSSSARRLGRLRRRAGSSRSAAGSRASVAPARSWSASSARTSGRSESGWRNVACHQPSSLRSSRSAAASQKSPRAASAPPDLRRAPRGVVVAGARQRPRAARTCRRRATARSAHSGRCVPSGHGRVGAGRPLGPARHVGRGVVGWSGRRTPA